MRTKIGQRWNAGTFIAEVVSLHKSNTEIKIVKPSNDPNSDYWNVKDEIKFCSLNPRENSSCYWKFLAGQEKEEE